MSTFYRNRISNRRSFSDVFSKIVFGTALVFIFSVFAFQVWFGWQIFQIVNTLPEIVDKLPDLIDRLGK